MRRRWSISALVQRQGRRWRLWRVCRALGIKATAQQRRHVIYGTPLMGAARRTGKTTAVVLRVIVVHPVTWPQLIGLLAADPDLLTGGAWRSTVEQLSDAAQRVHQAAPTLADDISIANYRSLCRTVAIWVRVQKYVKDRGKVENPGKN